MDYSDVVAMAAFLVAVWAVCAAAAGMMLWAFGLAGYGLVRAWDWAWHRPGQTEARQNGRKHGRRTAEAKAFRRVSVLHRVFPLV